MQEFAGTDRFTVLRRLGSGGMGVVYLAHDRERGVDVALKTLARVDARSIAGLKNEFRALADVTHPNLVALHELFCEGGVWFFTMEVVEGTNFLDHVIEYRDGLDSVAPTLLASSDDRVTLPTPVPSISVRNPVLEDTMPLPTSLGIRCELARLRSALRQLVEAVVGLHAAGKLHRDIKPTNVLITSEGRVVILDFGLAVIHGGRRVEPTTERFIEGTPAYMAPEQTLGEPAQPASDWYAVGAMLYEALTGQLPFNGDYRDILAAKRVAEPPRPGAIAVGVPADLDELCVDLLRRDPLHRPDGVEVLRRLGVEPPVFDTPSRRQVPFMGRTSELAALHDAFARTRAGEAVIVHVRGRSGMGKSALLDHFLDELWNREGALVLSGRCYERESVPYKAWDNLIDTLAAHLTRLSYEDARRLIPPGMRDLARVFPVLLGVDALGEPTEGRYLLDSIESRRRAFDALRELLRRLATERSAVLYIDDLQWGDVDSAKLMANVFAPPSAPPLLLIASYRSDESETSEFFRELSHARPEQRRVDATVTLDLGRLSSEEAEALGRRLLGGIPGAARLAAAMAREADGNPFFVGELAWALRDARTGDISALQGISLDATLRARVARLSSDARRLLEVLAVAARPIEQGLAGRAANLSDVAAAVSVLRSRSLIRTRGPRLRDMVEPYHDRIREAVVRGIEPQTLRACHLGLARALEAEDSSDAEALAVHFEGAAERTIAAGYAARAAEHAMSTLAFDRAAHLYRVALALGAGDGSTESRRTLLMALASALVNAARGAEAAPVFLDAARGLSTREVLELRRRAAEQFLISGHIDEGVLVLRDVLHSVGVDYPETALGAKVTLLARLARLQLRGTRFQERSEVAPEDLARIDVCASAGKGLTLIDPVRGLGFWAQQLLLALRAGDPERICAGLALHAANVCLIGGQGYAKARRFLDEAQAIAERLGNPYLHGLLGNCTAATSMFMGRWRDTVEASAHANSILRASCSGVAWEIEAGVVFTEVSLLWMGRLEELAAFVQRHVREALDRGDRFAATYARMHTWYAPIAADDVARARIEMREAIEQWSQGGFHIMHFWALYAQTQYDLYAGEPAAAHARITKAWPALESSNILRVQFHRVFITLLRGTTAVAAAVRAQGSERARLLRHGERWAARLEGEAMPYASSAASLLRASLSAASGRLDDALPLLNAAETGFQTAEMDLFAACARRRRGELTGGEKGRLLMTSADTLMREQGIVKPDRWTAIHAPGFS